MQVATGLQWSSHSSSFHFCTICLALQKIRGNSRGKQCKKCLTWLSSITHHCPTKQRGRPKRPKKAGLGKYDTNLKYCFILSTLLGPRYTTVIRPSKSMTNLQQLTFSEQLVPTLTITTMMHHHKSMPALNKLM